MSVHTYLDASTGYVTAEDARRLDELSLLGGSSPLRVIDHEYGFWIHHNADAEENRSTLGLPAARAELGLSDDFWKLMDEAHRRGCSWVNLDKDGDTDIDLPTHEW